MERKLVEIFFFSLRLFLFFLLIFFLYFLLPLIFLHIMMYRQNVILFNNIYYVRASACAVAIDIHLLIPRLHFVYLPKQIWYHQKSIIYNIISYASILNIPMLTFFFLFCIPRSLLYFSILSAFLLERKYEIFFSILIFCTYWINKLWIIGKFLSLWWKNIYQMMKETI